MKIEGLMVLVLGYVLISYSGSVGKEPMGGGIYGNYAAAVAESLH